MKEQRSIGRKNRRKKGGSYDENEVNYSSNSKLLVTKNGDVPRETKGMKGQQKRRGEDNKEKGRKDKEKESKEDRENRQWTVHKRVKDDK